MSKQCIYCKEVKTFDHFTKRSDRAHLGDDHLSKYSSTCKECQSLKTKLKFFNITKEDFLDLRESHNDCCAICGIHESDARNMKTKHYGLYLDHCHDSGEVRGLLCHNCNLVLGQAKDDIRILKKAIDYLSR